MFRMGVLANFGVDNFEIANNKAIGFVIIIVFIILLGLVMMNLIIAIITESYEKTQEEAEGYK